MKKIAVLLMIFAAGRCHAQVKASEVKAAKTAYLNDQKKIAQFFSDFAEWKYGSGTTRTDAEELQILDRLNAEMQRDSAYYFQIKAIRRKQITPSMFTK